MIPRVRSHVVVFKGKMVAVKANHWKIMSSPIIACKISGYHRAASYQARSNCAKIVPKGPISEALGVEEKMMMKKCNPAIWPPPGLALYDIIWQQYVHR